MVWGDVLLVVVSRVGMLDEFCGWLFGCGVEMAAVLEEKRFLELNCS